MIPYGRHEIHEEDIAAVVEVLRGDWLTTGPMVSAFENAFARFVGAEHGVAVANGTAALHLAMLAAGIGPGDEVIVAAMTFAASANCARYVGADVRFADVKPASLTIDPESVRSLVTEQTRAIVAVDYAGIPCDLDDLMEIAVAHDLVLIEDACHAPGATYRGRPVGSIAHMSSFSFHPVKHLTTGEGGMVTTNDERLAGRVRRFRNHGIETDFRQREQRGTFAYNFSELGFNYRLSDINCALGLSQLNRLPDSLKRRQKIAETYFDAFTANPGIRCLSVESDRKSAWHLFPIMVDADRGEVFRYLRSVGIGVNVHYQPVYFHSYYQELGYPTGLCPVAEEAYEGLLSLPMWDGLTDEDQERVIREVLGAVS